MAIGIAFVQPSGNIAKVRVDVTFLAEFIGLAKLACLHIVGSCDSDDGRTVGLLVQGEIVPAASDCVVEISRTITGSVSGNPGASVSIVLKPLPTGAPRGDVVARAEG
ncbi:MULTISPECIES: hypothetical protein [unclassified Rhizobium]|uniref:hypothetical protein n=1 Tax=unclassified Rhizobium TaxID=2613769 RepID=UPI00161C7B81|nr:MULTISPECIES: hypothetical protein [unclassified Rhizobium]MBB3297882.1 hypothetical protein [Rhizobium sp. BK112]MBB4177623.1 hypothetical protein [Rhizobium sp. BK109]